MRLALALSLALAASAMPARGEAPRVVRGLKSPDSAVVGPGGKVYVTLMGEPGRPGDGSIAIVDPSGKVTPFATGLDDPRGLIVVGAWLYVADVKKVWRVDARGKPEVFVAAEAFPRRPYYLDDIAQDGLGNFFVLDSGNRAGAKGAVFRIDARKRVTMILDGELTSPLIRYPKGLLVDDPVHLLLLDFAFGHLYRYDVNTQNAQRIGGGFGNADGLAREPGGSLVVADGKNGRIFRFVTDLEPPMLLAEKIGSPAGISVTPDGKTLLVPDTKAGTLTWLPIR